MRDLATAIPDVEVLLALEPEELGAKLLFSGQGWVRLRHVPSGANARRAMDRKQKQP